MKLIKLKRREEILGEIYDLENEIQHLNDELESVTKDEDWRNDNRYSLRALRNVLNRKGSGPEQRLVNAVLDGDNLDSHKVERLKCLAIQFLQITL